MHNSLLTSQPLARALGIRSAHTKADRLVHRAEIGYTDLYSQFQRYYGVCFQFGVHKVCARGGDSYFGQLAGFSILVEGNLTMTRH